MQREDMSVSGHEKPNVSLDSTSLDDAGDDCVYPSAFYPSMFLSMRSNLLNDGSPLSSSLAETDDELESLYSQIQQKLHQDLMGRYQSVLSELRIVAKQAHDLHQENVNLKMVNLDLNNRLKMLLRPTSFHGFEPVAGPPEVYDGLKKMHLGPEEGTSETTPTTTNKEAKSPTSAVDSAQPQTDPVGPPERRIHLPKSISVRSSGYLKATRSSGNSNTAHGGASVKTPDKGKFDIEMQKVYVKGGKTEQPLELEVYNQGMFKTELCNKWQQTGTCPYGNNCQFAHGIRELRPVLRHPRYKTEVCRMVLNGVPCPYGHRCHFRHSLTDQENLTRAMNAANSLDPFIYQ
ncbi:hypothetical protein M569_12980 [Genlisea aurea]|uniref:C3H1-type domain-containing protein n=1 Tax=Genlisea aurea TaxID=192259 RepID=S8DG71_9LAMI|nr:hypothetical protein M569_12980 [Genlisea aurea]